MLLDMLSQALGDDQVKTMSRQLGADEGTTRDAIGQAVPMLLGALARNTSQGAGAQALSNALARDHDGSVLDDLAGFLGGGHQAAPGEAILGHILGGQRSGMEAALSRSSGLDMASVGKLLAMLAPIIMGGLGKVHRDQGLGPDQLAGLLGGEVRKARSDNPALGLLSLFDKDGDGSVVDDVARIGAGMLGNFLKKE